MQGCMSVFGERVVTFAVFCPLLISGSRTGLVWIFGHSYVCWGARRGDARPEGRQLGFSRQEACIRWLGVPGMLWERMLPEVQRFAQRDRPPDVLVLHVGGNDLGRRTMMDIMQDIKADVERLMVEFPGMVIVWSDMVARTTWRMARSVEGINRARKKINNEISKFIVKRGGLAVRYFELEQDTWRYLRRDGVHLTDVGIDMWVLGLQDGVQRALRVWRGSQE